MESDSEFQGDS